MKVKRTFMWDDQNIEIIKKFFDLMTTEVCDSLNLGKEGCSDCPFASFCGEPVPTHDILGQMLEHYSGIKYLSKE